MSAPERQREMPFKRNDFRFRNRADFENVAYPATWDCAAASSCPYLRYLAYPLSGSLQQSDGLHEVVPSHPEAPRQHRIGRVQHVVNSRANLLVLNVGGKDFHRPR